MQRLSSGLLFARSAHRQGATVLLRRETLQQIMVNLFAHLDVDHPPVADDNGQSTEPVFLQAGEGVEEQPRFSVADARWQTRHRVRSIQELASGTEMRAHKNQIPGEGQ